MYTMNTIHVMFVSVCHHVVTLSVTRHAVVCITDNITHLHIPLEDSRGNNVIHPTLKDITLVNGAILQPAVQGNGADFAGDGPYMTLGEFPNQCISQLEHCNHGLTLTMHVNPREFLPGRDTFIMSTQTYDIFYRDGRLVAEFRTPTREWTVSSDRVNMLVDRVDVMS